MVWTKIGDEFPDAAADLSDGAFRLHVEALTWSNRRLLDLMIPSGDLRRFAFGSDSDRAATELVESGWWQQVEGGYWVGCRFAEWQRDRVQVEHERVQNSLKQRRRRRHLLGDHSLCLPSNCQEARSSPSETPGDSPGDSPGDPGRVGSGRDGKPQTQPRQEEQGGSPGSKGVPDSTPAGDGRMWEQSAGRYDD